MSTPNAPESSSNPPAPSVAESFATMFSGSLMSIIWTPLSTLLATMAYVLEPIVNVSTSCAPLSSSNSVSSSASSSVAESFATMFVGSLMSIIWTWSDEEAATMAYVLEPITNVSTPYAPPRFGTPAPALSILSVAVMFVGSLMSIIWTP